MPSLEELLVGRCSALENALNTAARARLLAAEHRQGSAVALMQVALSLHVAKDRPVVSEAEIAALGEQVDGSDSTSPCAAELGVRPPVQALVEGRGTDMDVVLSYIRAHEPIGHANEAMIRSVCAVPFNYICSVARVENGWRLTARGFPVRQGRGGAAIWWSGSGLTPAFYPLGIQVWLSRGRGQAVVEFSIWPSETGRRPLCEVGPYQVFHGNSNGASQLLMMRAANVLTRGIVRAEYSASKMLACIELEVSETKGIMLARAPQWCIRDDTEMRIIELI